MTELLNAEVLAEVLSRHGSTMEPKEYAAIFAEVADATTDTLTEAEHRFLVEEGGVDPALLTPESQVAAQARIKIETARADAVAARRSLGTREVASLLGTAAANVRRAAGSGDLYTAGRGRNREHSFPAWQFADGEPLPSLRAVIEALPTDLHPLDVEYFMTSVQETLRGRSPVAWLSGGGDPARVVRLADELGRG